MEDFLDMSHENSNSRVKRKGFGLYAVKVIIKDNMKSDMLSILIQHPLSFISCNKRHIIECVFEYKDE